MFESILEKADYVTPTFLVENYLSQPTLGLSSTFEHVLFVEELVISATMPH